MQIKGFHIIRLLGEGTFGSVFQAYTSSGVQVAIKILKNEADSTLSRFVHEAQILSVNSANKYIVSMLGSNLQSSPPYIVMEYCDGGSLRTWVTDRRHWKDVAAAMIHASRGLITLHQMNGFHRDVKPDNLLLSNNAATGPIIKLGDFGLARVPTDWAPMTHTAAGTDGYMAPELSAGESMSAAADIYSLGITGIELLTGKRAASSIKSAVAPRRFQALLREMIASDATQRPSAIDVAKRLTDIFSKDTIEQEPSQSSEGLLAGLLIGGVLALGGIAVAIAIDNDAKAKIK